MSTITYQDAVTGVDRVWPIQGKSRVPAWVYSDEQLYEKELQNFFGGATWNYVALDCEIPEPGAYVRSWIGRTPVIAVRDEGGEIQVLENRCAHRGSIVCWAPKGVMTDITCPYHQWNYDLHGNLQGLPFFRGAQGKGGMPRDFDMAGNGLRRLNVTNFGGSIWASFERDVQDFESYLGPDLEPLVRRVFNGRPLRLVGYSRQLLPCNWKIYFDNSRDPYHATLLHSFFLTFGLLRADTPFHAQATSGGRHGIMASRYSPDTAQQSNDLTKQMRSLKANFTLNDMEVVRPVDEFGDSSMINLSLFPSAFLQQHGNSLAVRQIIPKSVNETELSWTYYGYADDDADMIRRRLKQGNLLGPAGYVAIDDGEVATQVQHGIDGAPDALQIVEMGGRESTEDETMLSESLIRAFYAFYREQMGL
jgi:anthranilate 1,2-dioxygenase large subunit